MKLTIKIRMAMAVAGIVIIVVGMFMATWIISSAQKADGLGINLAGRQRMLSQKLAKETLYYTHLDMIGQPTSKQKEKILVTTELFDVTLKALTNSGPAPTTLDPKGPTATLPKPSPEVEAQFVEVNKAWLQFKAAINAALKNNAESAVRQISPLSIKVLKSSNKAVGLLQAESEVKVQTLIITQSVCVFIGLLIAAIIAWNMHSFVIRPLDAVRAFAKEVSEGNLEAKVAGNFTAELLALKDAILKMVANLRHSMDEAMAKGEEAAEQAQRAQEAMETAKSKEAEALGLYAKVNDAAQEARSISDKLSASADNLANLVSRANDGTTVQRDRMTETATAMDEMNATVLEVARNAGGASDSARDAKENAQVGASKVQGAVSGIAGVQKQILVLNKSMEDLGSQATNIGQIMDVITDIADQTNLLALNAAIEAARAGDAGRGFAVVADEVRKLAEKTMAATGDVGHAVESIQKQTDRNIVQTKEAVEGIKASAKETNLSGELMADIVGIVESTAAQVASIAAAAEEQSASSEQITRAVGEVNAVAEETSKGMDDAFRAIEELAALALDLADLMRRMTDED